MLQNYSELFQNEFYEASQIRTNYSQFLTNCTPCVLIYCTPRMIFQKGYSLESVLCHN